MKITILFISFTLAMASCQSTAPPAVEPTPEPVPKSFGAKKSPPEIKPYPLVKCLVTDEPLDEWDDLQTTVFQGQEMKFCCEMCLKKFKKSPQKYLVQLP